MLVLFTSSHLDLYDWCLFLCASRPGRSFTVRVLFVFLSGVGLASCTCKGGFSGFLVSPRIPSINQQSEFPVTRCVFLFLYLERVVISKRHAVEATGLLHGDERVLGVLFASQ